MGLDLDNYQLSSFRSKASLKLISKSHTLRCDAKQADERFSKFDSFIESTRFIELNDFFPNPFVKGTQPTYVDTPDSSCIPVINTLSIQKLKINIEDCRYIAEDDFQNLSYDRKLRINDILLTVDGGTSIGKAVLFDLEGEFTVDSHVAILRPIGIDPKIIVYLLASPVGQLQFVKAESGASGQTGVTEDDIRRFRFPRFDIEFLAAKVKQLDEARQEIMSERLKLEKKEKSAWARFCTDLIAPALESIES